MPSSSVAQVANLPNWVSKTTANWRLLIFDRTDTVVDVPEADVESIDVEDILNGGSGAGTIILRRGVHNIGRVGYGFTCALWIWRSHTEHPYSDLPSSSPEYPADPYYVGHVVDINQEEMVTTGKITLMLEGEAKLLDDGLVDEAINPGIDGNGTLSADGYLRHVITTYQPPTFNAPGVPTPMFNLQPVTFDNQPLGSVIDSIVKQGRDTVGLLYTWRAVVAFNWGHSSPPAALSRYVLVIGDQNPNVVAGIPFHALIENSDIYDYKIETKYRGIKNVVAAYGGNDPITQIPVYSVFEDAASVALFGAKEDKISNTNILDLGTLATWAQAWLDINAYPQAQVSFRMVVPDYRVKAGFWVRVIEAPTSDDVISSGGVGVSKDLRVSNVKVKIQGQRIDQFVTTVSPTPYLDQALYIIGFNAQTTAILQAGNAQCNATATTYIRFGGDVTARSSGPPPTITFSAGEAVFGGVLVPFATITTTIYGGDGQYYWTVDSTGAWHIYGPVTKAPNLPNTELMIREATIIGGVLYA